MEGGLQLRDVATQNLAMGGKILWKMITGKRTWSKKILQKKYFTGDKERCLERPTKLQKGSSLFSLCKRALPFFTSKLTWTPGNGAKIRIWEDSILGDQPLNDSSDLGNIKDWLLAKNCSTLRDISSWSNDEEESWERWNLGDYPHELKEEAAKLLELLKGSHPLAPDPKTNGVGVQDQGNTQQLMATLLF